MFFRSSPQDVVHYLEREAAEGSEATEASTNRPTSVTPNLVDPRFSRQSISRSEAETSKLGPSSPLVPLEQLLQQDEFSGQ